MKTERVFTPFKKTAVGLRLRLILMLHIITLAAAFAQKDLAAARRNEKVKTATSHFFQVNSIGDVLKTATPHQGRFHAEASLALWTSDYFRARYGGVPARLDYLSYRTLFSVTYELLQEEQRKGLLRALSLSAGNINMITDPPVPDEDIWYTSDTYIGLAAGFKGGIRTGLTYTAYINPLSGPGVPQDIALQVVYAPDNRLGSLQPELKFVKAVGQGTGALVQAEISPMFNMLNSFPLTITTPLAVGAGFQGYHGANADGYYTELGLVGTIPLNLKWIGRWTLSAGTFLTLRSEEIVEVTEVYDQAGSFIPSGFITLAFVY